MDFPGKIDAYVAVRVEDPEGGGLVVAESLTSIIYKDYNPRWNHVFSVPATAESARYVVRFHVFDKDLFRSEEVGQVVVPLATLLSSGAPQSHPIALAAKVAPRKPGEVPSLKVGASITRDSDTASSSSQQSSGVPVDLAPLKVTVTVSKASSLPKRDLFGKIDPYVVVTAFDSLTGRELAQLRTGHISREYNPVWNFTQSFDITPDSRMRPRIEFLVFDKDNRSKDDASGSTEVAVQPLPETALTLRLAPGTRPSGKSAVAQLWASVSLSGPAPIEWAVALSEQSGISHSLHRPLLNRLALADPAVELRVQAVQTMDQPALDHHFNMALLLDIKQEMDSGDILLFRGSEAFSMQIRWASRSNYSHSAIIIRSPPDDVKQLYHHDRYLENIRNSTAFPELREAMLADDVFVFEAETDTLLMLNGIKDGLQLVPITYWLSKYYEMCGSECLLVWRKLIRQQGGGPSLNGEQRSRLHMWLRDTVGRRYKASKFRQINGVFKTNRRRDYSTFFCSELVTASLAEVGVMPASTIGTNFLPVDLASEERHDGRDIVLNEPFKFLRERRLRLVPPTAQVDSGASAFAITDTVRFKVQKAYAGVRPFEELITADRLSGNADIEVLKRTLAAVGDVDAAQAKEEALANGWIRPYLALVSLHPLVRLQIAMLLQVDITAAEWYGNPHREAATVLHKLVMQGGQPNWASALIDCADNFYEDTQSLIAPVVAANSTERHAASCGDPAHEVRILRPLEIAVISVYRPLVQQRFPSAAEDIGSAASNVTSIAELRLSLGERAPVLDIVLDRLKPVADSLTEQQVLDFCVFMVQGGGKKLVRIVNEQLSLTSSKKSVRGTLPLIFAQLSLQILLLFVEGIGSLRAFYPDAPVQASSSSSSSVPASL